MYGVRRLDPAGLMFPAVRQTTLAERAARVCSNPDCRQRTVLAAAGHFEVQGEVCSILPIPITPLGPAALEELGSLDNGLWLCTRCAGVVNEERPAFRPRLLRSWREEHEGWVRATGALPDLPEVWVRPLRGLPGVERGVDRVHELIVGNRSPLRFEPLVMRLQLPEQVISLLELPPGLAIRLEDGDPLGLGRTPFEGIREVLVEVPVLRSRERLRVVFSTRSVDAAVEIVFADHGEGRMHFGTGTVQYSLPHQRGVAAGQLALGDGQHPADVSLQRTWVVPIEYDLASREITSAGVDDDVARWRLRERYSR